MPKEDYIDKMNDSAPNGLWCGNVWGNTIGENGLYYVTENGMSLT